MNRATQQDPRRIAESHTQLVHAVERLEPLLAHLEHICKLLVEITATARAVSLRPTIEGHSIRYPPVWSHISEVIQRAQLLARQVATTVDELEKVIGGRL